MKLSFLRHSLLALGLGLALAACGSGKAEFDVKGSITGLVHDGLVLTNNGGNDLTVRGGATSFTFPGSIEYGTAYNVDFKKQPDHQTCIRGNSTDTAGRQLAINVLIECTLNAQSLGGFVAGLTVDGLELINGSNDRAVIAKDATSYVFPTKLPYGTSYGITIFKQPAGLRCSLINGTGIMGDLIVENVNVTCVPA